MNRWKIYLGRKLVNVVYCAPACSDEYVRKHLINHDGYHMNIRVVLDKRAPL